MTARGSHLRRVAAACLVAGSAVVVPQSVAAALPPPVVDLAALGPARDLSGQPRPLEPTEQRTVCAEPVLTGGSPQEPPFAQRVLDLPAAWQFSRGAGQKVAVIDTGVNPHPRLPALQPGGDFVSDSDGTVDCDGHGTLVAGIIAARPDPGDAFTGVAPEAEILTIRQLSLAFEPVERNRTPNPGSIADAGYGNVLTLAAAVVRAVDLGATVINISEVACTPAGGDQADAALGAAVRYAYERNVVVVVAAGNLQSGGSCAQQNERSGWGGVQTVASPAWFQPYVLPVASVDPDGAPSALTLYGPWVGVAAIGRDIVSLDSKPGGAGLVNGVQTAEGIHSVEGTSFAAPYVAGLAALIRSRYPELTAQQVIDRITRTAHAPGPGRDDRIGHGLIDPLAALTAPLPDRPIGDGAMTPRAIAEPAYAAGPDPRPRRIALAGSIAAMTVLGIGLALARAFRHDRDELPELDPPQDGDA
ncbi:type VII secretion-associated serine protease mycosin [Nocardia mangyaensis]|uniref:Type VII secretion-associated serine protease mycosin n=1 Tax=Nocardia mangyaensis TaxID=2213200 RepID=A0A1J0VMM0_9NOCA|nr:type VII secretion-associated serine protease mycosin [Nocardia mangyaensis]APE33272.1 type VII secretion-associated serine protease mycosin [Nocardia mangyaensis]